MDWALLAQIGMPIICVLLGGMGALVLSNQNAIKNDIRLCDREVKELRDRVNTEFVSNTQFAQFRNDIIDRLKSIEDLLHDRISRLENRLESR